MARHNEIDCRLFNKLFRRNALMDVLKELDENGITYELQDVRLLDLPNIRLPWTV